MERVRSLVPPPPPSPLPPPLLLGCASVKGGAMTNIAMPAEHSTLDAVESAMMPYCLDQWYFFLCVCYLFMGATNDLVCLRMQYGKTAFRY